MITPEFTIELMGGLRLRRNEQVVCEFAPQQAGMLLAFLALHADRPSTREEVIAWLLPDDDLDTGRNKLRQYLYALRRELAECAPSGEHLLVVTRNQISLNAEVVRTDVALFEAMIHTAATSTDVEERIRLLSSALSLYRGELLPGFYGDDIETERRRLTDVHQNALLALAGAHKQAGDLAQALVLTQRIIALDPLQEEATCEAMRLYAATGRIAAAQRQYQRLTEVLKAELGVEPSPATQRLMQELRSTPGSKDYTVESPPPPAPAPTVSSAASIAAIVAPQSAESGAGNGRSSEAVSVPPASAPPAPANGLSQAMIRHRWLMLALFLLMLMIGRIGNSRLKRRIGIAVPTVGAQNRDSSNADIPPGNYGADVWQKTIKGKSGDEDSEPTAMAIDDDSNIYITGFVHTAKHDVDYVTLKYDLNGREVWQSRYNNPACNDCDRARAIAVDPAGNVYVTGESYNRDWDKGGTDWDVATIKYDRNGRPSSTWPDVGFGPGVRRYDGAHRADWGKKIALDRAGNVYVGATCSEITARGERCSNITVLKYDLHGRLSSTWPDMGSGAGIRRYSAGNGQDDLVDMKIDSAGNIVVVGIGRGQGHSAIITLKYDAQGRRKWVQPYNGPGDGEDAGCCLALDRSGNVYVAGYVDLGPASLGGREMHIVTLKYSAAGELKWCQGEPNPSRLAKPAAIAVDSVGNVVVVGTVNFGMEILTYDSEGWIRWSRCIYGHGYAPINCPPSVAHDITVDGEGNIFVTGSLANGPDVNNDYATLRFNTKGTLQPLNFYDGPRHRDDEGLIIARDRFGDLIVTGYASIQSYHAITTLKYRR